MITASTNTSSRTCHTICLPFEEASYRQIVTDPRAFRAALDQLYRDLPELFPPGFDQGDQFKDCRISSKRANRQRVRGWALLYNFSPRHPATAKANNEWKSPAERLNPHRYHDSWLHNPLISASLGGYRIQHPQK